MQTLANNVGTNKVSVFQPLVKDFSQKHGGMDRRGRAQFTPNSTNALDSLPVFSPLCEI
jgi:hypothetical protein